MGSHLACCSGVPWLSSVGMNILQGRAGWGQGEGWTHRAACPCSSRLADCCQAAANVKGPHPCFSSQGGRTQCAAPGRQGSRPGPASQCRPQWAAAPPASSSCGRMGSNTVCEHLACWSRAGAGSACTAWLSSSSRPLRQHHPRSLTRCPLLPSGHPHTLARLQWKKVALTCMAQSIPWQKVMQAFYHALQLGDARHADAIRRHIAWLAGHSRV